MAKSWKLNRLIWYINEQGRYVRKLIAYDTSMQSTTHYTSAKARDNEVKRWRKNNDLPAH